MRATALATALMLSACAASAPPTVSGLAGANNAAALDAAVDCRLDQALAIARGAESTPRPPERLFSLLTQAALLTELGRTTEAERAIDTATADPALNPQGRARDEIAAGAASLGDTIRTQREAVSGSATC